MKSLNEFDTLEEAQSYTETTYKILSMNIVVGVLSEVGLARWVWSEAASNDKMFAITVAKDFNFDPSHPVGAGNRAAIDGFIAQYPDKAALLTVVRDTLISMAKSVTRPHKNANEIDFNIAKGVYPSAESIEWNLQNHLIVTLQTDLDQPVNPLIEITNEVYQGERVGRTKTMQAAGRYVIPLNGLSYLGRGTLEIKLPCAASFTVEVI